MKLFIDELIEQIEKKQSRICVGLDPHPDMLPEHLVRKHVQEYSRETGNIENKDIKTNQKINNEKGNNNIKGNLPKNSNVRKKLAAAVEEFNKNIIDNIYDIAPAVKPQAAFYELLGTTGMETLYKTIEYARDRGLLVILDAKRNDIGSTAAGYARAYLGHESPEGIKAGCPLKNSVSSNKRDENAAVFFSTDVEADCLTINPYLGKDGVEPFLRRDIKGAFILLKTSNESGSDIQDLVLEGGKKVYEKTAELISEWGQESAAKSKYGYSNLGAVVGATYPGELKEIRELIPNIFFLIPGFGFQGGKPEDIVYGFDREGRGAIVNSSRGINFAFRRKPWCEQFGEKDYAAAARAAAVNMKEEINKILEI